MSRFQQSDIESVPCMPYQHALAKLEGAAEGLTVFQHGSVVGTVASLLLDHGGRARQRLLPRELTALASLHDVGKVSAGFQKKIHPRINTLLPELTTWSLQRFEEKHAVISEAALQTWIKNQGNRSDDSKWGGILGSHHGERMKPAPDVSESYGGLAWHEQRMDLISDLMKVFGPLDLWAKTIRVAMHTAYGQACPSSTPRQMRAFVAGQGCLRLKDASHD